MNKNLPFDLHDSDPTRVLEVIFEFLSNKQQVPSLKKLIFKQKFNKKMYNSNDIIP